MAMVAFEKLYIMVGFRQTLDHNLHSRQHGRPLHSTVYSGRLYLVRLHFIESDCLFGSLESPDMTLIVLPSQ